MLPRNKQKKNSHGNGYGDRECLNVEYFLNYILEISQVRIMFSDTSY